MITLSFIVCLAVCTSACTFTFGNNTQQGYCTFFTSQGWTAYFSYNHGCYAECRCKIDKNTGVSYMPIRGCLESYPCYNPDGSLTNFSEQYVSDNVIGDCDVVNNNDQCAIQCKCKEGYSDYTNSFGKVIKCGQCQNCRCDINLTSGEVIFPSPKCPQKYDCAENFLDRINVRNTIKCTSIGPNCDLTCECKPGYKKVNEIECDQCTDCTCPLNLTTSSAFAPQYGCDSDYYCRNSSGEIETFSDKYDPENVNNCWVTSSTELDTCTLKCSCKPKYIDDGDVLCGSFKNVTSNKTSNKLSVGAIVGTVIGAIAAAVIVICVIIASYYKCCR